MAVKYALTNIPYTMDDIKLGSLVPNKTRPNQDTFGPNRRLRRKSDFTWRNQKNFNFVQNLQEQSSVRLLVTRLLSFSAEKENDANTKLWSREGRIYELTQPKKLFRQICRSQSAREWLIQNHDDGEDIHFIVGYRTFFDATESDEINKSSKAEAEMMLPRGEVASGGIAGTARTAFLEAAGDHSSKLHEEESFKIPGERIFAICFRKVCFKWSRPQEVDSMQLEKDNIWAVSSIKRGHENGVEMIVGVKLGDDNHGNYHSAVVGDGAIHEEYYVIDDAESSDGELDNGDAIDG